MLLIILLQLVLVKDYMEDKADNCKQRRTIKRNALQCVC